MNEAEDADISCELCRWALIGAALAVCVAACNNQTGFSGSVGNTPNGPKLPSYQILGDTPGTPFTATISDDRSFWTFQGNVPLSIVDLQPSFGECAAHRYQDDAPTTAC